MPALKNPRHEAFAQAYVRGDTAGNATQSYRAAYGRPNRKAASDLLRRPDISGRIGELQAQVGALQAQATTKALERYEVTAERIIGELTRMGFANMLDYIRVTETGDAVVDLSALDRDKATAISEVVVDVVQDGKGEGADTVKRVRFKLADKRAALVDLGKRLGMFVDRKHVTLEHGDKTDDERACRDLLAI
jgi:phage terminase small subunit